MSLCLGHCVVRRPGQVAVEERADFGFGQGAGKFVNRLSADKEFDRWNAANPKLAGNRLLFLGVDLGQDEPALIGIGQLGEYRH